MIAAAQKDEELLADIAVADAEPEALHLWWMGQSGFLMRHAGKTVFFDPYLSDALTKKYARTDKPHVRMTERCVDPSLLTGIDFITASHVHTDHLDGETLRALAQGSPGAKLLLPRPIREEAEKRLKGADLTLVELGEVATEIDGLTWTAIPAAHNEIVRDDAGCPHCIGFLLRWGAFTIYHSGDTLWHPELVPSLLPAGCDLMLLPINGNEPGRRVAGNLNGTEAAALAKACGARRVVPCHYDMFEFNTATPVEFADACERLGQVYSVLRCGEHLRVLAQG